MLENNQKELILLKDLGMLYPTEKSKKRKPYAIYECPYCKNHFKTITYHIRDNVTKSCGCLGKAKRKEKTTKHGLYKHRLYNIYTNIKYRCLNKNHRDYINYGARGITVCDDWKNDFLSFYNWALENGYKDSLEIDRINNDGNYEPNNCRWTTRTVQNRNKRLISSVNTSGYKGITWDKSRNKWASKITINSKSIYLGRFETKIQAAKAYDQYVINNNLEHTRNFE